MAPLRDIYLRVGVEGVGFCRYLGCCAKVLKDVEFLLFLKYRFWFGVDATMYDVFSSAANPLRIAIYRFAI